MNLIREGLMALWIDAHQDEDYPCDPDECPYCLAEDE